VFAAGLEANVSLRADIRTAIENGLPVYAECGSLMYLSRSIHWGKENTSRLDLAGPGAHCAFRVTRGSGLDGQRDGLVYKNVLATYTHLHALSTPEWAPALVVKATEYQRDRGRTDTRLSKEAGR
jgi:cobyrinic acid a,c-diamide synthase